LAGKKRKEKKGQRLTKLNDKATAINFHPSIHQTTNHPINLFCKDFFFEDLSVNAKNRSAAKTHSIRSEQMIKTLNKSKN
jgi:hypothetical protein